MESHFITTEVGKIHIWSGGNPEKPAILLLHAGLGDAQFSWLKIWTELSEQFYVIAPDLPGFGYSPKFVHPSAELFVEAMKGVLDVLGIARTTVVGNSIGAGIAYEFAARYPEHTLKLVLVNGCKFAKVPKFIKFLLEKPTFHSAFVKMGYQKFFGDKALRKEFSHAEYLEPQTTQALQSDGMKLSEIGGDLWLNTIPSTGEIKVPVSVFWGEKDKTLPLEKGQKMSKDLRASFHPFSDSAHMPQLEEPHHFLRILKSEISAH